MLPQLAARILTTTDPRCLGKFMWNFGVKGMLSVERFKRRLRDGEYFPPFLYISIINSCNLRCQGCWVDVEAERSTIDLEAIGRLITEKIAERLRRIGNATPLISIEGREIVSDERRGKKEVFARTLRGLDNCLKARLLTGVA